MPGKTAPPREPHGRKAQAAATLPDNSFDAVAKVAGALFAVDLFACFHIAEM